MQLWRARRRDGGPDSMTARRSAGAESFAPAAGGTPWKGRLRSYHATPQSLPMPRLPSSSKNQEVEGEVQTLNKKVVPTKNGKGRKAGAVRQPRALQCQLLQHRGRDPEHPIVIEDEVNESIHKKVGKDPSIVAKPKAGHERLINIDENIDEPSRIEREGMENFCGADDWTEEQDTALRKAYFTARPSPHFWKRVSKLVPGRSAKDCFNRIHADLSTPTPIAPRPRTSKTTFSPIGNFSLSDPKLPNLLESTVRRQRIAKRKSLATQKTVRHLLQKHCLIDQAQEADHFPLFETSPSALELNISSEYSPRTPESYLNSDSLGKCSGSLSAQKKPFSRLKAERDEPSPAVLKPIKNVILHEKYVDQLSRREGTKKPRKRTPGSKGANSVMTLSRQQAGGLKAAKNALISEATDFISQFKKLQANSLVHIVEDREDNDTEFDASDNCHDDDKE
ncbi:uncharacterized protein LOC120698572 isoform X2 [Panicum virgatum]|uniref:uncharacterized protein LOC120698572 isoform X2 n=1 Tax=Panicum virgatum TaxID=38727 RepID=UPI0019D53A26|nr:uncharacterized protein LOC120698572 isoform X2 [Panicum virgatum]